MKLKLIIILIFVLIVTVGCQNREVNQLLNPDEQSSVVVEEQSDLPADTNLDEPVEEVIEENESKEEIEEPIDGVSEEITTPAEEGMDSEVEETLAEPPSEEVVEEETSTETPVVETEEEIETTLEETTPEPIVVAKSEGTLTDIEKDQILKEIDALLSDALNNLDQLDSLTEAELDEGGGLE